jgi:hypothetical protein
LEGLEIPVQIVHRGRGKRRRTVIGTTPELSRQAILRHLKRRWGIAVMFRLTKEQFGLGECRLIPGVSGWLATLGRLLMWSGSFFSPLSLSRREPEVILAP